MHSDNHRRPHCPPALAQTGMFPNVPPPPAPSRDGSKVWIVVVAVGAAALLGILACAGFLVVTMGPAIYRAREAAQRASCANNLKQFGLVFKMYANENRGTWPELLFESQGPLFNTDQVYPDYFTDAWILRCPSDDTAPQRGDIDTMAAHSSYAYLGYVIRNEMEARQYLQAVRARLAEGGGFTEDLPVPGSDAVIYRLREGVERHLLTPEDRLNPAAAMTIMSRVPVMFGRSLEFHEPGSLFCLYMDGHVQIVREGEFPAAQWFLDDLKTLAEEARAGY